MVGASHYPLATLVICVHTRELFPLLSFRTYPFTSSGFSPSATALGHLSPAPQALPAAPRCGLGPGSAGGQAPWGRSGQRGSAVEGLRRHVRAATQAPPTGTIMLVLHSDTNFKTALKSPLVYPENGATHSCTKAGEVCVGVRQRSQGRSNRGAGGGEKQALGAHTRHRCSSL